MSLRDFSPESFRKIVGESNSVAEALRKMGGSSGSYRSFYNKCEKEGVDIEALRERSKRFIQDHLKKIHQRKRVPLKEILIENSTYPRGHLKNRLIKKGLFKNFCSNCGMPPEWDGKPLVMVIDHINGIRNDHRLKNLRLLCPNCNSQTSTFCGKNDALIKSHYCVKCGEKCKGASKTRLCILCGNPPRYKVQPEDRPDREELLLGRGLESLETQSENGLSQWASI